MRGLILWFIDLIISTSTSGPLYNDPAGDGVGTQVHNANHIFNAIHSSMRQWGSAWNHNGMSFFLASVPEGTQLYHGTDKPDPVTGLEWLAFEPEHALIFAQPKSLLITPPPPPALLSEKDMPAADTGGQVVLTDKQEREGTKKEPPMAFLHTYITSKSLRLLYLDGLSAGKTDMGTLDSQDYLLFRNMSKSEGRWGDRERAQLTCQLARDKWKGRIDGIIRAESGFEIMLCDFASSVDVLWVNALHSSREHHRGNVRDFDWYRGIAARFNGIGGERVHINYDSFVTAYAYKDIDLFQHGGTLPRLVNISAEKVRPIQDDLTRLVLEHKPTERSHNWQSVTDMIVARYSDALQYLISDNMSHREMRALIEKLLMPFVDARFSNATAESERCAAQFIPTRHSLTQDTLAARVVYSVSHTICLTLRAVLHEEDHTVAVAILQDLVKYLSWTTWKECSRKCAYNEICYIPVWPYGTTGDREDPQCRDRPSDDGVRYWTAEML